MSVVNEWYRAAFAIASRMALRLRNRYRDLVGP
jgi:hypothetical protein